jgi:cytidylate kinase
MIITIDGAAGTGKSTVAKKVAQKLDIAYFDTGAMYRAFAFYVINTETDPHDVPKVINLLKSFKFHFEGIGSNKTYYVNNVDVTSLLRTPEVTDASSVVSQYPEIRNALHQVQKNFAKSHDAVFEGRDLGTVIFPNADYKFFLKASDHVRAERRFAEMKHKGIEVRFDEVLQAIRQRDSRDEGRKVAPLKCAEDAHVIDTSELDIDDVVSKILQVVGRMT